MRERAANREEKSDPDPRYFSEAVRWENDVIRSVKHSRSVAWIIATISALLAVTAMA
jgi:type IV secretion system protein VirB8